MIDWSTTTLTKVSRRSRADIVSVWAATECRGHGFATNEVSVGFDECGELLLSDSAFDEMTREIAIQLLSLETVEQLEARAESTSRNIVFTLGVIDDNK